MIPKIIHYCWFGRGPKPDLALKCIGSWKTYLPEYEIKEWNEDNFDVNMIPYVKEAYSAKKYAFVSDYARFWILYKYGGLYFDTDVEVIKNMDHIVSKGPFMGFEQPSEDVKGGATPNSYGVAPGLGLGVNPGLGLYKELLDYYAKLHFIGGDGKINPVTIVKHTTDLLIRKGLKADNTLQEIEGITIYPWDYFCPQSFYTQKVTITPNTVSVHLYSMSWLTTSMKLKFKLINMLGKRWTGILVKLKQNIRKIS